jgi:hypothetical protein
MKTYSQSHHGNIGKLSLEDTEALVVGAKVMTPLTAAMRLLKSISNNQRQMLAEFSIWMPRHLLHKLLVL